MADMTPQTRKDKNAVRIDKTNDIVDSEVVKMLKDLDIVADDLDAIIEILKDRLIQSTDVSFPIALARLSEVRMDTFKKRIDILKTLVTDKGLEVAAKKKTVMSDFDSILSGVAMGAALGAKVTTQKTIDSKKAEQVAFETIDADVEEIEFETEHFDSSNSLKESSVDRLLSGE